MAIQDEIFMHSIVQRRVINQCTKAREKGTAIYKVVEIIQYPSQMDGKQQAMYRVVRLFRTQPNICTWVGRLNSVVASGSGYSGSQVLPSKHVQCASRG